MVYRPAVKCLDPYWNANGTLTTTASSVSCACNAADKGASARMKAKIIARNFHIGSVLMLFLLVGEASKRPPSLSIDVTVIPRHGWHDTSRQATIAVTTKSNTWL